MTLTELKADWVMRGRYQHLGFDCPLCRKHRIEIPVGDHPKAWKATGTSLEVLSITPSIWFNRGKANPTRCDVHLWIRDGKIEIV